MHKELKKLMTKVAKGEITMKDAELLIKSKKTQPEGHNTRKRAIKSREVK